MKLYPQRLALFSCLVVPLLILFSCEMKDADESALPAADVNAPEEVQPSGEEVISPDVKDGTNPLGVEVPEIRISPTGEVSESP